MTSCQYAMRSYIKANKVTNTIPDKVSHCFMSLLFQTPTIWVSTDSPGPQQPRFYFLSSEMTLDPKDTEVTKDMQRLHCHFSRNPYNVGAYRLPWTLAVRIWHLYKHIYGCLFYNPLGSRSEQGRPEGPILRVLYKAIMQNILWRSSLFAT